MYLLLVLALFNCMPLYKEILVDITMLNSVTVYIIRDVYYTFVILCNL